MPTSKVTKRTSHDEMPSRRPDFALRPVAAAVAVATLGYAGVASAAQPVIEEVVVTATKRSESAQDVPLAITALSGDFTKKANLNDVKDLVAYSPGVSGNSQDSFIDAISVRGIRTQDFGVGGDPSTAFFKNDLYEGRNGAVVSSLYDMERSEVLRGPQGFLFGRNSIGGAFSVHTAKAQIGEGPSGYVDLDVAERGHVVLEGAVNIPVNDQFAMRLAGYSSQEDGFVDNRFNGDELIEHDKQGFRWSTAFATDKFTMDTMVEWEDREQSGSVYRAIDRGEIWDTFVTALGGVNPIRGDEDDADSDQSGGDADDADLLSLGVKWEYDFDFATLTSNTGYKDHEYFYSEDYDGTPLSINNYTQDQEGDYFQQEFRLTSNSDGPLSWYAGVSYYQEDIDTLFEFSGREDFFCQYYGYYYNGITFTGCADLYAYYGSPFTPQADGLLRETGRIVGDYSGWGAYVDLNYEINEQWDIGVGVRYTDDEKDFSINVPTPASDLGAYWAYTFSTDGAVSDTQSWDDITTRVIARYRPNNDSMIFGSYTEGFKAGGFGSFALNDATGAGVGGQLDVSQAAGFRPNAFEPETADSWEIGYKGTLAEGRAQVSLVSFYYEYEDLQVVVFDGGASAVENVGEVESWGAEGTVNLLLGDYWDVYLGISYLDTEATGLQSICGLADPEGCEGSSLFWAPEWTGSAVVSGRFPLNGGAAIVTRLEAFWESERGGGFENLSTTRIDSFTNATFRIGYEAAENWEVNLYVENLTDEDTYDGLNNNGGILPSHFFGPMRPRTVGVSFSYEWE